MTVLEAIQKSAEFLAKRGVDSPRLQSELLLAHVLKTQRLKLYLTFERVLSDAETSELRELVKRRGNREPLQHILGSTSFCGVEIKVNCQVLIPRPETELLAEEGWKFLNEIDTGQPHFLDFGAGSGCISIALCRFSEKSRGVCLDRSAEALAVARENALLNQVGDRLDFIRSDGFESLGKQFRFDLIISNPPYIPTLDIETLQEEVKKHDPHTALNGGADGLDFYRLLAERSKEFLIPKGRIMVEFGDAQEKAVEEIFTSNHWSVESILNDYTSRPRILSATPD
jgi:release factor glutamine methyltransferase